MIVDGIVIAVLLVSAIIAFLRGFIRETLTILGVVGGTAASWYGGPLLSPTIRDALGVHEGQAVPRLFDLVPYTILADLLSYGLIFIVVVVFLSFLSHIMAESARAMGLGPVDRTLGVVFGLARGILLLGILYLPVYLSVDKETKARWFEGSKTDIYLETISGKIAGLIPGKAIGDLKDNMKEKAQGMQDKALQMQLEQIDLLKSDAPKDKDVAPPSATDLDKPADNEKAGPGYSEEFRQKMDQMFKQDEQAPAPAKE
jgi:membrane protein required for colicin V production